jgi:hypothetical protein
MALRLRSVLGVLAVMALLTVFVSAARTSGAGGPAHRADHTAIIAKRVTAHPAPTSRGHRPLPLLVGLAFALLLALGSIATLPRRGTDRLARLRIDDASERWRALLLGAPPVPA